jgi:hypothetical protein
MKKFTYLVIATAALSMVACTGGNKAGYTITGTVEGESCFENGRHDGL